MRYLFLWICCFLPFLSSAQQSTSTWYLGKGTVLNFSQDPVQVSTSLSIPAQAGAATYTSPSGQVVLSVTETGIFNRAGQLLPGGRFAESFAFQPVNPNLLATRSTAEHVLIVAAPGTAQRCYVFYLGPDKGPLKPAGTGTQLNYALVDVAANNGAGAVVRIDQVVTENLHGFFTVSTRCADEGFWLVTEANTNPTTGSDRVLAFRVTSAGIAPPVVSVPITIGHSYSYKFSPTGEQLVFNYDGNADTPGRRVAGVAVARFDPTTGAVSNLIRLGAPGWEAEFSASGRMLYLVKADSVVQYDLSSGDPARIRASGTVLQVSQGNHNYRKAQLAPDGRIYVDMVSNFANVVPNELAVIAFPERRGVAAAFTSRAVVLPQLVRFLPKLAAHSLYSPPLQPDAGPDVVVCEDQSASLRGVPLTGHPTTWSPATYLSTTTTATPTFRYTGPPLKDTLTLSYALSFFDGTCTRQDLMLVKVLPLPPTPVIAGSQSVCPGVVGVAYRVTPQPGHTYRWRVSGGTVASGQGTATVRVNWGRANGAAQVQVEVLNTRQCPGPAAVLPVRLNAVLQPAMPQGPVRVCLNQRVNIAYEVAPTAGSVYTWTVRGVRVRAGQGTSQVAVDWDGAGVHALSVAETSTTPDALCFGTSGPLRVTVFQDSTQGHLTAASIGPGADTESTLTWSFSQALRAGQPQALLRRAAGAPAWQPVAVVADTVRTYQDQGLDADQTSYEYLVRAYNDCGELIAAPLHRTVRLTASPSSSAAGPIQLDWTAYLGWPAGVTGYEVWRRLDTEPDFIRLRQIRGSTLQLNNVETTAGFNHHYRIRALTRGAAAWSNTVDLAFEHALVIPNIFTPNGDGHNDTFFIPNLVLYPDNVLVVFNRWGKKVYEQSAYKGEWAASAEAAGLFYYQLHLRRGNTSIKGWVEVVK